MTPVSSEAEARTLILDPLVIDPAGGEVIDTVGGILSPGLAPVTV